MPGCGCRAHQSPSRREWKAASLLGALIFLVDYGCLFWAEQRVPSGIAAVVLATIPVFITLMEITILRTQRLTVRLGLALAGGIVRRSRPDEPFGFARRSAGQSCRRGSAACGGIYLVNRHDHDPPASASCVETDERSGPDAHRRNSTLRAAGGGGRVSRLSSAGGFWNAWFALFYLIIAGSIVGFTAYVWLLHYESPTKVGTYAYVNPVVAVSLGYFFGGEAVGPRTLLGTLLVLVSVITITTTKKKADPIQRSIRVVQLS